MEVVGDDLRWNCRRRWDIGLLRGGRNSCTVREECWMDYSSAPTDWRVFTPI